MYLAILSITNPICQEVEVRTLTNEASHIVLEALQEAHLFAEICKRLYSNVVPMQDTKHLEQAINYMRETLGMKPRTFT